MSELNRDEIINALGCCIKTQCENCCNLGNWHEQWNCMTDLMRNALTIINQLTEDNTKLADLILEKDVIIFELSKQVEGLTEEAVKRFADRLKRYYDDRDKYLGYSIAYNIDQVAEAMIKGNTTIDNKCVACGEIIPEGRQVCPNCEGG